MDKIIYNVPLIRQGVQECAQASATQLLNFFGINKSFKEVKKEIPLYISSDGTPIGVSIGHMACYLLEQGFKVTLHVADIEIFDQSWIGLSNIELITKLTERRKYIKHAQYEKNALDMIVDGYKQFLSKNGEIVFPTLSVEYVINYLQQGPVLAVVSYNYLNKVAKYVYNQKNKKYQQDGVKGSPGTHMVVISGYKNRQFLLVDPDFDYGGERWVDDNRLIGSVYLAETDFDSLIMTVNKKS